VRIITLSAKRIVYDVLPKTDGWKISKEGGQKASATAETKKEAVQIARDLAKGSGSLSQVRVHGQDGKIQTEWTYGKDPHNIPG
jgi:hypothetical protein